MLRIGWQKCEPAFCFLQPKLPEDLKSELESHKKKLVELESKLQTGAGELEEKINRMGTIRMRNPPGLELFVRDTSVAKEIVKDLPEHETVGESRVLLRQVRI